MSTSQKKTLRTFIADVEDRPGVLARIATLFRRRAFNIDSLTVGRTAEAGVSRTTVVMSADEDTAARVTANLYKLVNVLAVEEIDHQAAVVRDLALIKVRADAEARPRVLQLVEVFHARVIDVGAQELILEITGTVDKIDGLVAVLEPFGIVEMVRTGAVAMSRGAALSQQAAAEAA